MSYYKRLHMLSANTNYSFVKNMFWPIYVGTFATDFQRHLCPCVSCLTGRTMLFQTIQWMEEKQGLDNMLHAVLLI